MSRWTRVTERMPNPDEHEYVLIYTEGYDFGGLQYFEVLSECLNEHYYAFEHEQPEECQHASHWMPLPFG